MRIFSSKSIYTSDAARAQYERENGGAVTGIVDARTATKEEIGLLMTRTESREGGEARE